MAERAELEALIEAESWKAAIRLHGHREAIRRATLRALKEQGETARPTTGDGR